VTAAYSPTPSTRKTIVRFPKSDSESKRTWPLLKRTDQVAVAALVLVALGCSGVYWVVEGGARGRLIEIDRATHETARFQIDINEADWPEWTQLPDIGETIARRIVESRDLDGPFTDVDDLRRVRGIGPKTLERMKPYLRPVPRAANVAAQAP
jgi:competence protein ComEA